MVPTLQISNKSLQKEDFINAYVNDPSHDVEYSDSIFLLFKPRSIDKFREFLDNEYERTKDIIEDYDYEDGYVVVVYKLNMEFKDDFNLVKKGKYSMTSKSFQKLFPSVVKIVRNGLHKDELSLQCRVFNKTPDLVEFWENEFDMKFREDWEVWRGWDEKDEILDIDKIRSYVK